MTTNNDREGGGGAEGVLGSDVVLVVNPRVTTIGGGEDSGRAGPARVVSTAAGGSISLATLRDEERELLSLADGDRSVDELVRLSTMAPATVQKHLRSLLDRGILVRAPVAGMDPGSEAKASAAPAQVVQQGREASDDGAPATDGSSALTKAIDEYLELAATALISAAGADDADDAKAAVAGAGAGPTPADESQAALPPEVVTPAEAAPAGSGGSRAPSGPTSASGGTGQTSADRPPTEPSGSQPSRPHPQTFRPNVTAFWIPSMAAETMASPQPAAKDAPSGPSVATDAAPPQNPPANAPGSGPTVVVTGSPPTPGSPSAEGVPRAARGQAAASAPIPFRVGAYEVATRIAQGGMGSIYVCRRAGDSGFQRLYTLKVVRQHSAQREEAVRSFQREAHVGSLLTHPNLQTVRDVGSYKDQPFLVLDYIDGTTLSELISEDRRAPVPVIVSILLDILRGLHHAHQVTDERGVRLGLVHGDVSPQNVLVGVDGVARMTDFGSASLTGEGKTPDPKRVPTGKPAYMSPEQLRAEPLDARTDVFAVGVLMWSALTGQKLFAGETYDETIIKVLRKKIPPPSTLGAPAVLDEICLKALARSREGRYATADEMARDLLRVASAENLLATAADVGQWVRRESGEVLAEQRRRIQLMFASPRTPAGRISTPLSSGRVNTPFATRSAAATVVLDAHNKFQTPKLGANKSLPARTIFLPNGRPRKTFWRTWNVVIVSALLALPVTLTIGYFVSNFLLYRPQTVQAQPTSAVDATSH